MKYFNLLLALLTSWCLQAQNLNTPTLSPITEIKQEVGLTEISLAYSRPSANGRVVFGELVPYGEVWRTGANASTKLTFAEDVKIAGNDLPAGTYALYTIPGRQEWTIIIHKKTNMRSIAGDQVKPENDAFRFAVKPMTIRDKVETFTIQFADITSNSCRLQLSWENTTVKFPIEVEVDAKMEVQIAGLLQDPEKAAHFSYFLAAEYYLHNDKDLNKAMEWIDAALAKSPENFRYGLLRSKIYAAQGKTDMAKSMVKTAHEWANAANNANYKEQTLKYLEVLEKGDAQMPPPAEKYATDVSSMDNILNALYASISGEKGEKRDWDRFRHLFIPEARLMPSGKDQAGKTSYRIMSPDDYVQSSGKWLEENGFYEKEISREVVEYGSLVHVFSTYESFRSKADKEPFARGINSIQLLNDGERWWVVQIYWLGESKDLPLPEKYLQKK